MKNFITGFCLALSAIVLFSFKISKKERIKNAILTGFWMTGEITNPNGSHIKVFEDNGSYYNVGFENGENIHIAQTIVRKEFLEKY